MASPSVRPWACNSTFACKTATRSLERREILRLIDHIEISSRLFLETMFRTSSGFERAIAFNVASLSVIICCFAPIAEDYIGTDRLLAVGRGSRRSGRSTMGGVSQRS